jgi:hypothetical protein
MQSIPPASSRVTMLHRVCSSSVMMVEHLASLQKPHHPPELAAASSTDRAGSTGVRTLLSAGGLQLAYFDLGMA